MDLTPADLFDLDRFAHRSLFDECEYVWQALPKISGYVRDHAGANRREHAVIEDGAHVTGPVSIGRGTVVEAGAYVRGPAIIGAGCQIRTGAYLRGDVLIGDEAVVGNSSELKNTVLMNGAAAPHYNYCGDSILGKDTNLGAGTKLSNYKLGRDKEIRVLVGAKAINTGLVKFGAVLGDGACTGCNSVLNPGTVLGRNVLVYANAVVGGCVPHDTIVKLRQDLRQVRSGRRRRTPE